jgi:SnoaL-like domain
MPVVTHHRALILPSSPPASPRGIKPPQQDQQAGQGILDVTAPAADFPVHPHHHHPLLVPYELVNGCTEQDCVIESDNALLTNAVRKHFLLHFGHRDSHAMLHDYAPDAVLVHVLNGTRSSFHGHSSIRNFIHDMLQQHPTINSTFSLRNIHIMDMDRRTAKVMWSAQTPTQHFSTEWDVFHFDRHGKIVKQVRTCHVQHLETPWYVTDE